MKETYYGNAVAGTIFQGVSGRWVTDVSYVGVKSFDNKQEAIEHMKGMGCFEETKGLGIVQK